MTGPVRWPASGCCDDPLFPIHRPSRGRRLAWTTLERRPRQTARNWADTGQIRGQTTKGQLLLSNPPSDWAFCCKFVTVRRRYWLSLKFRVLLDISGSIPARIVGVTWKGSNGWGGPKCGRRLVSWRFLVQFRWRRMVGQNRENIFWWKQKVNKDKKIQCSLGLAFLDFETPLI